MKSGPWNATVLMDTLNSDRAERLTTIINLKLQHFNFAIVRWEKNMVNSPFPESFMILSIRELAVWVL